MTSTSLDVLNQFREWYQHQIPRLFNYVGYWVHDGALAEDLTASICEQALHQLHRFDAARGSFDAWMFGIARNALRMHFRAQSRHPAPLSLDGLPEIRSTAQSIEEHLERAERFREVMHHLTQLSSQEREVVALRFGAGLSNTEAAAVLHVSANQIGVVLHRALGKLRAALHHLEEEGNG
jgi:RNA polymerase sigma factor (sigma-70 family)